jgi:PEP-CTERM motif
MGNMGSIVLGALGVAAVAATPSYAVNLVTNGGFETNPGPGQIIGNSVSGWNVSGINPSYPQGYAWIFTYAGASTTNPLTIYGPVTQPADGGGAFFYGVDSTFHPSALTQTISGLTVGQTYAVSFDWAAAQQTGYNGNSEDYFAVSLGSETEDTSTISLPQHTFSGWSTATLDFTATATSETLQFVDIGCAYVSGVCDFGNPGASGAPPFSLLDNVSMTAVPEPATWAMMGIGFVGLGYAGFRGRRRTALSIRVNPSA